MLLPLRYENMGRDLGKLSLVYMVEIDYLGATGGIYIYARKIGVNRTYYTM